MPSRPWDNPPACSNCGSTRVVWVQMGYPDFSDHALMLAVAECRVILGGCCVPPDSGWRCMDCAERQLAGCGGNRGHFHWDLCAGMFDPNESDAARDARERAEEAVHEMELEREAAHRATPIGAWEQLQRIVLGVEADVRKAEHGNKAAGARVRRAMREARAAAQGVRRAVLVARVC